MDCKVAVKDTQTQWLGGRPSHCHCKHPAASADHKNTGIGETPISSMTAQKHVSEVFTIFLHPTHGANAYKYQAKVHYLTYFVTRKRDLVYKEGGGGGFWSK
jgi:hypothetical protein